MLQKVLSGIRFAGKATVLGIFSIVSLAMPFSFVSAASLTNLSNTMSSAKISTASSHEIRFTTPTGASDDTDTIVVTFPADFDFTGKDISTVTFTHGPSTGLENAEVLAAAPSATEWGAVFSGTADRVLTLTAPTDGEGTASLDANHRVIISYDDTDSLNPSAPGSYQITINGTFGDVGFITVNVLSDDQVSVSATVDQSLTFSISDNTIGFGTLSSVAARYATGDTTGSASEVEAHNIIVGTNASNGYTMTLAGETLTSGLDTIDAIGAANTASATGTEQFGLRMTATDGIGAVSAPYAAAGFAFDTASFPDEVASSVGASADTTYSVRYLANIESNTEAGAYTAALTYVATANF